MTDHKEPAAALEPCPFCGKTEPVRIVLASEDEDFDPSNDDTFAVMCDASEESGKGPGGCGASSGYRIKLGDAIEVWNRRAPKASAVPEGWKLVPDQPDAEMLRMGEQAVTAGASISNLWRVMFRAAPSAPQAEEAPAAIQCEDCGDTGLQHVGYSGLESDGNAPLSEPCGSCGYATPERVQPCEVCAGSRVTFGKRCTCTEGASHG